MTIWNMEITASESPQTVHIPIEGKYYAIKNTGDHDILVSSYVVNPTEGADDVMKIPSGSAAVIPVKDGDLYVSAEEDSTYSVSIQDDKVIPWGGGTGSGGGSGDNTHYKGTTTTPLENGSTTNPIIIDGESYTAVFGDVVVYGYTEFVFDGTTWSEFGRPFDTVPTQNSTNAVTSDGVYKRTPWRRGGGSGAAETDTCTASGNYSIATGFKSKAIAPYDFAAGYLVVANGGYSSAFGFNAQAKGLYSHVVGKNNNYKQGDLFEIGNGSIPNPSNIVEVSDTQLNVNGDIKINNNAIPTPYTTMPTITERMLGKIAMYVGATGGGFTQGCFYIASTDGAAEPTYSWVRIGSTRTETVLWENEGTTNPDTITLSEAWSDFDELVAVTDYINGSKHYIDTHSILVDAIIVGNPIYLWYNDAQEAASYVVTSATLLTFDGAIASRHITKIIGIKY